MRSTGATGRSARARGLIGTCSSVLLTTWTGRTSGEFREPCFIRCRCGGSHGSLIAPTALIMISAKQEPDDRSRAQSARRPLDDGRGVRAGDAGSTGDGPVVDREGPAQGDTRRPAKVVAPTIGAG